MGDSSQPEQAQSQPPGSLQDRGTKHKADFHKTSQSRLDSSSLEPANNIDSNIPQHPASFNFPTLSPDGSVDDITTLSAASPTKTPPAALSSVGARIRAMADQDQLSEAGSSADEQYDMIDDLSEISNDDHDTASLASTERAMSDEGDDEVADANVGPVIQHEQDDDAIEDKPETSNSLTESEMEFEDSDHPSAESSTIIQNPSKERWQKVDEENQVMDSYLSEDLETPRQSTLPFPGSIVAAAPRTSDVLPAGRPLRVLFISDRAAPEVEKSQICAKVTSALAGSKDASNVRAVVLPLTPIGISPSSAIIYREGGVEMEVQHCVGAVKRKPELRVEQFKIEILDADGEHSSVYSIGGGSVKPNFGTPDLAIFYRARTANRPAWMDFAERAMNVLHVPIMRTGPLTGSNKLAELAACINLDPNIDAVLAMSNDRLRARVEELLASTNDGPSKKQDAKSGGNRSILSTFTALKKGWPSLTFQIITFIMILSAFLFFLGQNIPFAAYNPVAEHAVRKEALTTALAKFANTTEASKTFDIDHLLPAPSATSVDYLGQKMYSTQDRVHYYGAAPNHVVVSLPKESGHAGYRKLEYCRPHRSTWTLKANQSRLIEGVYGIDVELDEAHGLVSFDCVMSNPKGGFSVQHNFGSRIFHHQTYEKARTDISKTITKDITVARHAAKSISERIQVELSAGAAATRNVTTALAVKMTSELQLMAGAGASMLGKASKAGSNTVANIRKDLVLRQKYLMDIGHAIQKNAEAAAESVKARVLTKQSIREPLQRSRERALGFRQKLLGRKRDANSTSTTQALSIRLQDWVTSLKAHKKSTSLSTVPGKGFPSHRGCVKGSARDLKARGAMKRDRAQKKAEEQLKTVSADHESMEKKIAKHRAKAERKLQKARERAAKFAQG